MGRLLTAVLGILAVLGGVGWYLSGSKTLPEDAVADMAPDLQRGEWVFYAGGCASCHSAPDATGDAKLVLAGGRKFQTEFGVFIAPNISSDTDAGIGAWRALDLANALIHGTGPQGQHYYPAFPYTSYARMTLEDAVSLHAFLNTLPAVATPAPANTVRFPFNIRRSLAVWKFLFLDSDWVVTSGMSEEEERGRYLVEALGHCGECHTPRNSLGGLNRGAWLTGAPSPSGEGKIPGISHDQLDWSKADIAEYLRSGFTPEYDSAGGEMADVIENTSKLGDEDRAAIAAYLKIVDDG